MSTPDRVLVVDDDADIREVLASTLAFSGFVVDTAPDAATALARITAAAPDVVVLDVMMPGMDGYDLVHLLRHAGKSLPVLFLTARDEVEDRVRGLRLGGDDYVTKPFNIVELTARLQALVRRSRVRAADAEPSNVLECADLSLDELRHIVRRGDRSIDLSPTEFRLLGFLLTNAGHVVSKSQILDHVWNYDFGGDTNVVERFVSNLRRKVDTETDKPLIRTIRGFGYSIRETE
jgi:two-component system OmpR family response regulator